MFVSDAQAFGGAERYLIDLLDGNDHDQISILLDAQAPDFLKTEIGKADTRQLIQADLKNVDLTSIWRLIKVFKQVNADLVFFNQTHWQSSFWPKVACWLSGRPYVQIHHTLVSTQGRPLRARLKDILLTFISGRAKAHISPSQFTAQMLIQQRHMPSQKVKVIANGCQDVLLLEQAGLNHPEKVFQHKVVIFTAARLDREKGLDFLIQAVNELPELSHKYVLVIAGTGPLQVELEAYVAQHNLQHKVLFLGFRKDIPNLLKQSDIFVLPSLAENYPISIIEAMSASLPVVATRIAGIPEQVIDNQTGLLVEAADVNSLTKALATLIDKPLLRQRYGQAGRRRYLAYMTSQNMRQQTWDLLHSLIMK